MTEAPDYHTKYHEALSLLAECQAMLGTCISIMRDGAALLRDNGYRDTAGDTEHIARAAEVIRWKELP